MNHRITHKTLKDVLSDYVLLARSKGITEFKRTPLEDLYVAKDIMGYSLAKRGVDYRFGLSPICDPREMFHYLRGMIDSIIYLPDAANRRLNDFNANASSAHTRMAVGHYENHRHLLTGYYVSTDEPGITKLVRTCCGED